MVVVMTGMITPCKQAQANAAVVCKQHWLRGTTPLPVLVTKLDCQQRSAVVAACTGFNLDAILTARHSLAYTTLKHSLCFPVVSACGPEVLSLIKVCYRPYHLHRVRQEPYLCLSSRLT